MGNASKPASKPATTTTGATGATTTGPATGGPATAPLPATAVVPAGTMLAAGQPCTVHGVAAIAPTGAANVPHTCGSKLANVWPNLAVHAGKAGGHPPRAMVQPGLGGTGSCTLWVPANAGLATLPSPAPGRNHAQAYTAGHVVLGLLPAAHAALVAAAKACPALAPLAAMAVALPAAPAGGGN